MTEQPPRESTSQPGQGQPGQPFGQPGGRRPRPYFGRHPPAEWLPRRGMRHPLRGAAFALVTLAAIGTGVAAAAAHHSDTGTPRVNVTPFPAPSKLVKAPIGSAVVLAGNSAGEQVAVTVVEVFGHALAASESGTAKQGDQLYAVQFRLDNTGSVGYSDSPSNSAAVVDSAGTSYPASLDKVAGCASFPVTDHITAGHSGLGCLAFSVPAAVRITVVQFTLDSGLGPQIGQWDVSG